MNKPKKYEKGYLDYVSELEILLSIHFIEKNKSHFKESWELELMPDKAIELMLNTKPLS